MSLFRSLFSLEIKFFNPIQGNKITTYLSKSAGRKSLFPTIKSNKTKEIFFQKELTRETTLFAPDDVNGDKDTEKKN